MKKYYAIALTAIMAVSACVFSSCNKDDDNKKSTDPVVEKTEDLTLYSVAGPEQLNYFNATITVVKDNETISVSMKDMAESVADTTRFPNASYMFRMCVKQHEEYKGQEMKCYKYSLGKAASAKILGIKYTALKDATDHHIIMAISHKLYLGNNVVGSVEKDEVMSGNIDLKGLAKYYNEE